MQQGEQEGGDGASGASARASASQRGERRKETQQRIDGSYAKSRIRVPPSEESKPKFSFLKRKSERVPAKPKNAQIDYSAVKPKTSSTRKGQGVRGGKSSKKWTPAALGARKQRAADAELDAMNSKIPIRPPRPPSSGNKSIAEKTSGSYASDPSALTSSTRRGTYFGTYREDEVAKLRGSGRTNSTVGQRYAAAMQPASPPHRTRMEMRARKMARTNVHANAVTPVRSAATTGVLSGSSLSQHIIASSLAVADPLDTIASLPSVYDRMRMSNAVTPIRGSSSQGRARLGELEQEYAELRRHRQ